MKMKHIILSAFTVLLCISCGKNQKSATDDAQQPDSAIVTRVEMLASQLPKEYGAFSMEKCTYDGKTVILILRAQTDDPQMTNPEMLKWLPSMMLNDLHLLDTMMIKRLVELNQPLTYEIYEKKGIQPVKKFALTPQKMKGRAEYMKMF